MTGFSGATTFGAKAELGETAAGFGVGVDWTDGETEPEGYAKSGYDRSQFFYWKKARKTFEHILYDFFRRKKYKLKNVFFTYGMDF